MMDNDNDKSPLEDVNLPEDQEKLTQQALGNTAISNDDDNNQSLPKTTGTGSNPPSAAPNSLIVHEDENGEKTYEDGEDVKKSSE
ncbi:hypothetical protein [Pedobacter endophyticus]|uniref:Uncharacterized protein n=1 Tax=Pedobacter endophyticus TaxID=2789740 RepID=A0A7S9L1C5_9SPHI|nr:hypothetical protein [Pedobacter endophyticus]QPH40690.1 hypothetical protein IZT61_05320 [Pedobacter endophyticus]